MCDRALACDPSERQAFLSTACGADDELRREVESLLANETKAEPQPPITQLTLVQNWFDELRRRVPAT